MSTAETQSFEEQVVTMLNHGALCLMLSIGHRTGLYDTLATLPPSTSDDIAAAAKLNERYVREWLGAMVAGGIVQYEVPTGHYSLPKEHAACLTRASAPGNMAVYAQYIPLLGSVEDDIVHCFQHGGGVPYSAFGHFHHVMAEDSGQTVIAGLSDYILPSVPELAKALEVGSAVVDVGCGSGRALNELARRYPRSQFTGLDLSEQAIDAARQEAFGDNLTNVRFDVRDAASLDFFQEFDAVLTFDAIHDQADPNRVLANIFRMLKPNGLYLMQDIGASSHVHENIGQAMSPFLYTVSCMHCMTVSLAQGGEGLGAMWGKQTALSRLGQAGFTGVEVLELEHDPQNYYYVARKSASSSAA